MNRISQILFSIFISFFTANVYAISCPEAFKTELRFPIFKAENQSAVAVVTQGFNTKAETMNSYIEELNKRNITVVRTELMGHREGTSIRAATREKWLFDTFLSYCQAREIADKNKMPLIYVGYSLGGLLGMDIAHWEMTKDEVNYDSYIGFAPALTPHTFGNLVRWLYAWDLLTIPSVTPKEYRYNDGLPVRAYISTLESYDAMEETNYEKATFPTLIILHPRDELVSPKQMKRLIRRKKLTHWQKYEPEIVSGFHHVIFDPKTMGKENWQNMWSRIDKFLKPLDNRKLSLREQSRP